MNIPDRNVFQPSSNVLNQWLSTRKPEHTIAGLSVPGFFSDIDYNKDTSWFFFAIIGEVIGFALTLLGGMRSGGIFLTIAITTVVVFIVLDIAFARLLHQNKAEMCRIRSLRLLLPENDPDSVAKRNQYDIKLKSGRPKRIFLISLIIFIALAKAAGIILLGVFNSLAIYIPIIVIFFLIAYAHIYHTGYYFAYKQTQDRIEKEHQEFSLTDNKYRTTALQQTVLTINPLNFSNGATEVAFGSHRIFKDTTANSTNEYTISVKGVLTDSDVMALISNQNQSNQIILFRAFRQLQLTILSVAGGGGMPN